MNKQTEQELERWADRELGRLPTVRAPQTLFHRVMLAVHEKERLPWYRRSWPEWPRALQQVSFALLALVAGLSFWGIGQLDFGVGGWTIAEQTRTVVREWLPGWPAVESLAAAFKTVFKMTFQQFVTVIALLTLMAYAVCVALTAACYRLAHSRI
jgi:hypothetical protein